MIQGGGGQNGKIIDQPKRNVQREEYTADPGFFLHDADRKAPNSHHRDQIKGTGLDGGTDESDHRDGGISHHKGNRQPRGKGDLFIIQGEAQNRLHRGKHNNAARGERSSDDALEAEKKIGEDLTEDDPLHILELHSCDGGNQNKNADDIIGIFFQKIKHIEIPFSYLSEEDYSIFREKCQDFGFEKIKPEAQSLGL